MADSYVDALTSSLITTLLFIFLIAFLGLAIGAISIKNVSLGTGGVLIISIVTGIIFKVTSNDNDITQFTPDKKVVTIWDNSVKSKYSLITSLGTDLFVPAIGLISGPKFFRGFNKKSICYIFMGIIANILGLLIAFIIVKIDKDVDYAMGVGIFSGALTTTPGYSSALEAAQTFNDDYANKVAAGHSIAYIFGILGVVLFVQIVPKVLGINIEKERSSYIAANTIEVPKYEGKLFSIDKDGYFSFFLTIFFGLILGSIKVPISSTSYFSFGSSGGTLIVGLIIGHFGHIGPLNMTVNKNTLNFFRHFGLIIFLIGSGVPGGVNFIKYIKGILFVYGILMTFIPMIVIFLLGKYLFKISIFNNLGAITGSMTSTPALGSLIALTGTDEVSSAYAASYPVASFICVIGCNLVILIGG